jgi:putative glutathione S-transferase
LHVGLLENGVWKDAWYDTKTSGGTFERQASSFRGRIGSDGSSAHPAASGRYHLYVSLACPWAHRTLIVRALKGLEEAVSVSIVDPLMLEHGWVFSDGPGCVPDPIFGATRLWEIYVRAKPDYTGRVTVPVLWDKQAQTIVNNESSEILRMLDADLDAFATREVPPLYPEALRPQIDAINDRVYRTVNNGVYLAGFATTQDAYERAVRELFATLEDLEARLARQRRLVGDETTEADWRLFTTLLRFDAVYHGHFKCNVKRLRDFPRLWAYTRELYEVPGVKGTVDWSHIKGHYYRSHRTINPTGIVPVGPEPPI